MYVGVPVVPLVEWMRTISSEHRCVPNGCSGETVARSSGLSVRGRLAISARPPSKPAMRSR
jgi:hypothetical protein